jgi:ribose 5-phosphate isomerase B
MKIYLGADHGGFEMKKVLIEHLQKKGIEVEDCGAHELDDQDDYPQFAFSVASKVLGGADDDLGILLCKSGQGMAIAANRIGGIRAAIAWNPEVAVHAKADDNVNILVLAPMYTDQVTCLACVDAWLGAKFKAEPKYQRRLDEIEHLRG